MEQSCIEPSKLVAVQLIDVLHEQLPELWQLHNGGLVLPLLEHRVVAEHQPFEIAGEEWLHERVGLEVVGELVVGHAIGRSSNVFLGVEDAVFDDSDFGIFQRRLVQIVGPIVHEEAVIITLDEEFPGLPKGSLLGLDEEGAVRWQLSRTVLYIQPVKEITDEQSVL